MTTKVTVSREDVSWEIFSIGRKQELERLDAILQHRKPVVIVVSGTPGIGKTAILKAFQNYAESHGWRTTPTSSVDILRVTMDTTLTNFTQQIRDLLNISVDKSVLKGTIADRFSFVEELSLQTVYAPILLLIDGYQPTPDFSDWFAHRFVEDIKSAGKPIVVAVAERSEAATKLTSLADEIIQLGPLEKQAVKQHLEVIGQSIVPKMKAKELEQYVKICQRNPELLNSLTRVLRLLETNGPQL